MFKKKKKEEAEPKKRNNFLSFLHTVFILLLILYVALIFLSRTRGFKKIVEDHFSEKLKLELSMTRVEVTPSLILKIRGLESAEEAPDGSPMLHINILQLRYHPLFFLKQYPVYDYLRVQTGKAAICPDSSGDWKNARLINILRRLDHWTGIMLDSGDDQEKPLHADLPNHCFVDDGRIVWWDSLGNKILGIYGLDLTLTPVELPDRKAAHWVMSVNLLRTRSAEMKSYHLELLMDDKKSVVLNYGGESASDL